MKHTGSFVSKSDDPETSLKALRAMEHVVEALGNGHARAHARVDRLGCGAAAAAAARASVVGARAAGGV